MGRGTPGNIALAFQEMLRIGRRHWGFGNLVELNVISKSIYTIEVEDV